jgi:hypothetical protein
MFVLHLLLLIIHRTLPLITMLAMWDYLKRQQNR